MKMQKSVNFIAGIAIFFAIQTSNLSAASLIQPGDRVAVVGDSITEQKLYSKYIETYLLACSGVEDVKVFQYGWGGETAGGFASRMENDLAGFKPTVVTLCYGMNDGQYRPYVDDIGRNYEANMRRIIDGLKKLGVRTIIIGSPGVVDSKYFVKNNFAPLSGADGYNQNLGKLRDICKKLAQEYEQPFADVHQAMLDTMIKAKAKMGEEFDVAGKDGVHPRQNGHLVMAYAFLKAMGFDGNIGEISVDLNGNATATSGHKVLSVKNGTVEIESVKYPFCFDPDTKSPSSTRSILPFCSFNDDLNKLTLKVKNLSKPRARVKWGEQTKEFTKGQLESGINLAAEFSQTPFDENFQNIIRAIGTKQNYETVLIKNLITSFRNFSNETKNDPELAQAFKTVTTRLMVRHSELDKEVRQQIVPVKHTIEIVPID